MELNLWPETCTYLSVSNDNYLSTRRLPHTIIVLVRLDPSPCILIVVMAIASYRITAGLKRMDYKSTNTWRIATTNGPISTLQRLHRACRPQSMILTGDFYHFPPVRGLPLSKDSKNGIIPTGRFIWHQFRQVVTYSDMQMTRPSASRKGCCFDGPQHKSYISPTSSELKDAWPLNVAK